MLIMGKKRGQIKISFGMIFSIFLIIIFIAFAFYAIKFFIGFQGNASTQKLVDELRGDVESVWKSSESSQTFEYSVPKDIDFLCFIDFQDGGRGINLELYDKIKAGVIQEGNFILYDDAEKPGSSESFSIEHVDLKNIVFEENPYCIRKNDEGKAKVLLSKGFSDTLVSISRG